MKLKVLLPTEILIDQEVNKVVAEAEDGAFCLLPRHIGFVAALPPGILSFESERGEEIFLALDEGVLVKCGADVFVSVRHAVRGSELGRLRQMVEERFQQIDERERKVRSSAATLEAGFVRRFLEMETET